MPATTKRCPRCGKNFTSVKCPRCSFQGEVADFADGCPACGYLQVAPGSHPIRGRPRRGSIEEPTPVNRATRHVLPAWFYRIAIIVLSVLLLGAIVLLALARP